MTQLLAAETLRLFTAFLLLAAVAGKLRTFTAFRDNLVSSFGMSPAASRLTAPAVAAAEGLTAVIVLGLAPRPGMWAALLMFALFTALLAYRFIKDDVVRCSCFGEAERSLSGLDLLRNLLVLAAIAAYLALPATTGADAAAHMTLLGAGLASILMVAAIGFHDIVHLLKAT